MYQQMSLFKQSSYFDQNVAASLTDSNLRLSAEDLAKKATVTAKQLEDWCYRLQQAANEAGDEGFGALESDLLDIRDELLVELHAIV